MRSDDGLTALSTAGGASAASGARAICSKTVHADEVRESNFAGSRGWRTRIPFAACRAMVFRESGKKGYAKLVALETTSFTELGRRRFSSWAAMLQSVSREPMFCSIFVVGSRGKCTLSSLPNFKLDDVQEALEKEKNYKGKGRRHCQTEALAATAEIVQGKKLVEETRCGIAGRGRASAASIQAGCREVILDAERMQVSFRRGLQEGLGMATTGNCKMDVVSRCTARRGDATKGKNVQFRPQKALLRQSPSVKTHKVTAQGSEGTLLGGEDGGKRQGSKIILPHFTISEAKEAMDVCRVLEEEGRWTSCVEQSLFALLPKLNTRMLARILKRQMDPSLAWKLFQWAESLPSFSHDAHTFYALVQVFGKAEETESLWMIIDDMRLAGIKIKTIPFTLLISSYGRAGKVKEAEITLHSMREFKCKPNVYTYNAMLYTLLKARKTERALFTYSKMLHSGCHPDVVTFNTLVCGLCLNDYVDDAACFLEEMLKQGLPPDIRTCNRLISEYLKLGQLQEALNVFEKILKTGCKPDTITHTMLLDWLFKMGKVDDALVLFKEMASSSSGLDTVAFTAFLHGLFKSRKIEMAFSFFESLVKNGCANSAIFNIVVDWFCKQRKLDKAVQVLQDMSKRGILPDTFTFNSLIWGAFKEGRSERGLAFASQMMEGGCAPDLITYSLMVEFFVKQGELDDALALMKEMTNNGYQPDTIIYNPLMLGLFRAGKDAVALSTAREMMQKGCLPNKMTYRVLTSWLHKQGQTKDAMEFKKEMISLGCNPALLQLLDVSERLRI